MSQSTRLARRLTKNDAVILGLGSMIGAGIFSAAGPAADIAGSGLILAVLLAGMVAYLNATTMAQLAALYPESGGTYVYGRKQLGPVFGFLAGWAFVIGKIASCTAMALTFGHYAFPSHPHLTAVITVTILTMVNYLGIKKTAAATRLLVTLVLMTLALILLAAWIGGDADPARLNGWFERGGVSGVLQAAGIMFFAFAGYARLATLGEEVIAPKTTIPRAIWLALGTTIVIYVLVIGTLLLVLPMDVLAVSRAPLAQAVEATRFSAFAPMVRVGAALASLSVLLSLLAGISRTVFAMAANRDLPGFLGAVHPRHKVPHRAELLVGLAVAGIVGFADLRTAIGFSSFAILLYYAIANASAFRMPPGSRLYPQALAVTGFVICLVLAFSLPPVSILGGVALFLVGLGIYFFFRKSTDGSAV